MALTNVNETALDMYGTGIDYNSPTLDRLALSDADKKERRKTLQEAFANGPHPSQIQRRKDENWDRRCPYMSVMTGCGFHPLADRAAETAIVPLPPSASIPDEPTKTR